MDARPWIGALLLSMAATVAGAAGPGAPVAASPTSVRFYDIEGRDAAALRRSLDTRGPLDAKGVRHHGLTRWDVRWTFRYARHGGDCVVTDLQTTLTVTMTLPQWAGAADARPALAQAWARYGTALRAHEDGHQAIGVEAAEAVRRRLGGFRGGCDGFGDAVNAAGRQVIETYNARDLDYDAATRHGETQGARF